MDPTPGDDYVLRLKSNTDTEESDRIMYVPWIACFCFVYQTFNFAVGWVCQVLSPDSEFKRRQTLSDGYMNLFKNET